VCLVELGFEVLCLESELHDFLLVLGAVVALAVLNLGFIERSHSILLFHRPAVTRVVLLIYFQLIIKLRLKISSPFYKKKSIQCSLFLIRDVQGFILFGQLLYFLILHALAL
jgi:hypothetical protein